MADVRPALASRRGQLILVTAVVLAVTLVGLAVVLNSAIFAENVATRENDDASDDAATFHSAARSAVGEALEAANREQAGVHVRSFDATVEPTGGAVGTSAVLDQLTGGSALTFAAELDPEAGPAHRVAVYEDTDDGAVRVLVQEVGGGHEECAAVGTTANVSLTGRPTVDGAYCEALEPVATTDGPYNVSFEGSDLAVGTYRLVVDRHDAGLDRVVDRTNHGPACDGNTYHDDSADDPHSVPAIYAATVETTYRNDRVGTERTERVVPAQAGEGPTTPLFTDVTVTDDSDTDDGGPTDLTVAWDVSDPNGDLETVAITIRNTDDDTVLLADSESVADGTDSGSFGATASGDSGDEYVVELTVTDGETSRTDRRRIAADGDGSGCPP